MGNTLTIAVIGISLLPVLVGCGSPQSDLPEVVPVCGLITIDRKPITGVNVTFLPVGSTAGSSSYGTSDTNGRYELTSDDGRPGVGVGEFKVVCGKWIMPDGSDYLGEPGGPSPLEAGADELLPPIYSLESATVLTATVPKGGGTIDFDLKTKRRTRQSRR